MSAGFGAKVFRPRLTAISIACLQRKLVLVAKFASRYDGAMRTNTVPCLLFFCLATSLGYAGAPIKVCISDDAGKVAFKAVTQLEAPFVTPDLAAGNYVVQFNASSATLKGHQYLLVVAAGKTKVSSS